MGETRVGVSVPFVLFLTFMILKLCSVIAWSWWWVTAPLWIAFLVGFSVFLLFVLAAVLWGVTITVAHAASPSTRFRKR